MLKSILLLTLFAAPVRANEAPQAVVTVKVEENNLHETITGTGTFSPYNDITIKAEVDGRVEVVHFKEGDHAYEAQKLISFHNKEQLAKVKQAEASLKLTKNILSRKKSLFKKGFACREDLEKVEAQVQIDEASLAFAKEDLRKTVIKAPFEGVLSNRQVSKGSHVLKGDDLVRLQDIHPMRFIFHIPQKEIPFIKVGDKLTVTMDVYPNRSFEGIVEAIEPAVDEKSRSISVFATFDNSEKLLIPGLYGHAHLALSSQAKTALFIPEQALVIRLNGSYVYKVHNNKAVLTKVTLGKRLKDQIEILTGVKKGDVIVLEGQSKLQDGSPIKGKSQP